MILIVNGERIFEETIQAEVSRLKPHYQSKFQDQDKSEAQKQLADWAKENAIESVLLKQSARNDPREIPNQMIDQSFQALIEEHGGVEKLHKHTGLSSADDPSIRDEIEQKLRLERMISDLHGKVELPLEQDAWIFYTDNPDQFMLQEVVPAGHIKKGSDIHSIQKIDFDEVKQQVLDKLTEDKKNERIELYVDQLKQAARINYIEDDSQYKKALSSILVKPAGPDCNLDCDYCFYLEKAELFKETPTHRMDVKTLELMIRQTLQQTTGSISFGWQGGEPTLMGLSFFRNAVEFQRRYGQGRSVGNGLQTNGLLINKEWTQFLNEYNFLVGLSLDGPEHIHDRYRTFSNGKPSWKKIVTSAKIMLEAGVAVNVLTTVNDYSVQFPEEIYSFHKSLGFEYMQFIPLVETDVNHPEQAASYSVDQVAYGSFLCALFDLWQADFVDGLATTSIRHFDSVFHTYVGLEAPECTLLSECGNYVVVEHNAEVYSCDFFVEPTWKLGNLNHDDLILMLNSDTQKKFGELKSDLPEECQKCQWQRHCYGGCTKDRIKDPRDKGFSHFCESYKMFFQHADPRLQELAEAWRKIQAQPR